MIYPLCRSWRPSCVLDAVAYRIAPSEAAFVRYFGPVRRWHDDVSDRSWIIRIHYAQTATSSELRDAVAWFAQTREHRTRMVARARNIRKASR